MKMTAVLGLAQEIAIVAWTLAAAFTVLPGGVALTPAVGAGLALGAVTIAALALARRTRAGARRLPTRSAMLG